MLFIVCLEQLDLPRGYRSHPLGQLSTLIMRAIEFKQTKERGARDTSVSMQNRYKCLCSHFHIKGQYIIIVKT